VLYTDTFSDGIFPGDDWTLTDIDATSEWTEAASRLHCAMTPAGAPAECHAHAIRAEAGLPATVRVEIEWEQDFPALGAGESAAIGLAFSGGEFADSYHATILRMRSGDGPNYFWSRIKKGVADPGVVVEVATTANSGSFAVVWNGSDVQIFYDVGAGDVLIQQASDFAPDSPIAHCQVTGLQGGGSAGYFDNFSLETTGLSVEKISPDVTSLHAAEWLTITGEGFDDGSNVQIDGVDAEEVEFVDSTTMRARTARFTEVGNHSVKVIRSGGAWVADDDGVEVRNKYLPILLKSTDRAWSPTINSVGYRCLAARAAALERREAILLRAIDQRWPEHADIDTGLVDWDRDLDLAERMDLTRAQRRARVRAKLNDQPTIAWGAAYDVVNSFCVESPTLHEVEDYDEYGDVIWTMWIEISDENEDGEKWDWNEAQAALAAAKPAYAGAWVAKRGFIPGTDVPGRAVPVEEE